VQQWGVAPAQLRDQLGQPRSEHLKVAHDIAQPLSLFLTGATEGDGEFTYKTSHDVGR
jgi:hypothetical protein